MPKDTPAIDLNYALSLQPKQAMAYLHEKGMYQAYDWSDLWQDANVKAFTVAKVMQMDILQDLRDSIEDMITKGRTFQDFKKQMTPILQAKGWWGKKDGAQLGSPWRLETIYRTNLQSAYMAGRYKQQWQDRFIQQYWRFVAVMDSKTRPAHQALHGKVFKASDVFWETHYPPLGFNCRCRVEGMTAAEVQKQGIPVETGENNIVVRDINVQGKARTVTGWRDKNGVVHFTDPGFDYNPAKGGWLPKTGKYDPDIAQGYVKSGAKAASAKAQKEAQEAAQAKLAQTLGAIKTAKKKAAKEAEAAAKAYKKAQLLENKRLWEAALKAAKSHDDDLAIVIKNTKTPAAKAAAYKARTMAAQQGAAKWLAQFVNAEDAYKAALQAWDNADMGAGNLTALKQALDDATDAWRYAKKQYAPFKAMLDDATAAEAKYTATAAKNAEKLAAKKAAQEAAKQAAQEAAASDLDELLENIDEYFGNADAEITAALTKLPASEWNKLSGSWAKGSALQAQVDKATGILEGLKGKYGDILGDPFAPEDATMVYKGKLKAMELKIAAVQQKATPLLEKGAANKAAKEAAEKAAKEAAEKAAKEAAEKAAAEAKAAALAAPPDPAKLKKVGAQMGSNPGGLYEDDLGRKFYVKFYKDVDQARTEYAAGKMYQAMGLEAPRSWIKEMDGKQAFMTAWEEVSSLGPSEMVQHADDLAGMYHASVLVKNWDVVGLGYDNLVLKEGRLMVVDSGGAFKFRAQGAAKPFGKDIEEYKTFRDGSRPAGKVFNDLFKAHPELEAKSAKVVQRLTEAKVTGILKDAGFSAKEAKDLKDTIMARRKLILERFKVKTTNGPIGDAISFVKKEHQEMFEQELARYQTYTPAKLQKALKTEAGSVYNAVNNWQSSTHHVEPQGFKWKAMLMEAPHAKNDILTFGHTIEAIEAAAKKISDKDYIKARAITQAYLAKNPGVPMPKWRGIDGRHGDAYRATVMDNIKKTKAKRGAANWEHETMEIHETTLTGWTSGKSVAQGFGSNGIVVEREIQPHEIVVHYDCLYGSTGRFKSERESIVWAGRRDYELGNISYKVNEQWQGPLGKPGNK